MRRKPSNCRRRLLIQNDHKQVVPETQNKLHKSRRGAHGCQNHVSLRGSNAKSSHLCNSFQHKRKKIGRCVLRVLVKFPACSHQRPERHARCRVRDDGVPVLHVEPIRARLRQLRVVFQELQDDDEVVTPRPETQHCGHEQNKKRKFGQKGRPDKKKRTFLLQEYFRR